MYWCPTHCVVASSWIVSSTRIRALSWFLITTYQSHNNKNDRRLNPGRETHEYNNYITVLHTRWLDIIGVQINNYCHGKSLLRLTRDFLFGDSRKKLNSLTFRFRQVSFRHYMNILNSSITIHDQIKSRIFCLAKHQGHLTNYQFLMKRTQQ